MESRENDGLRLGFKLKQRLAHLPSLAQISEDPEDSELESESPYSLIPPSPLIPQLTQPHHVELPLHLTQINHRAGYFLTLLHKLEAYKGVVPYLLSEAKARNVIGHSALNQHKYYAEFIRSVSKVEDVESPAKQRTRSLSSHQAYIASLEPHRRLPPIKLSKSLMGPSVNPPIAELDERLEGGLRMKRKDAGKNQEGGEGIRSLTKTVTGDSSREDSYSSPSSGRSRSTSRYGTSSRNSRRGGLKAPPKLVPNAESRLSENRAELEDIFRKICSVPEDTDIRTLKATPEAFSSYLSLRYPAHMTTLFLQFFKLTSPKSFIDYHYDLTKILSQREDRSLRLIFDCFDFNQDKYICSRDTFTAISSRLVDCYDHDLVKIKGMFAMKRNRMVPTKKERMRNASRMSSRGREEPGSRESSKGRMPHYHPTKPEAIIFPDFQKIEFAGGKPQLLLDVFSYMSGLNLQDFNPFGFGFAGPADRPLSEERIAETYTSREAELQLQSDPRIDYYNDLTSAMNIFPASEECRLLLEKFKLLRCQELVSAVITEQSMVESFHKVFGAKCPYLARRIYYVFSGSKNVEVTKPLYLRTIYKFLRGNNTVQSRFIFSIYASRGDAIYQDDVNSMLEDLPPRSLIHKECMVLVDKFISSAVDKNQVPLEAISYPLFCEIVPESVLVKELVETFTCPVQPERDNEAFRVVSV